MALHMKRMNGSFLVQVSELYTHVLSVLDSDVGAPVVKKHKDWYRMSQGKAQFYLAVAHVS